MLDITFPIVGIKYAQDVDKLEYLLSEGTHLTLVSEPTNIVDSNAIKVMAYDNSEHIGYVPNKGYTCSHCWNPIDLENGCLQCGTWEFVIVGGLATRLTKTDALKKYVCFVQKLQLENKFSPAIARIMID